MQRSPEGSQPFFIRAHRRRESIQEPSLLLSRRSHVVAITRPFNVRMARGRRPIMIARSDTRLGNSAAPDSCRRSGPRRRFVVQVAPPYALSRLNCPRRLSSRLMRSGRYPRRRCCPTMLSSSGCQRCGRRSSSPSDVVVVSWELPIRRVAPAMLRPLKALPHTMLCRRCCPTRCCRRLRALRPRRY